MTQDSLGKGIAGKNVLITGASGGIGACMAKLFAANGARVGIHYNTSEQKAKEIANEIRQAGGTAELFYGDLLKQDVQQKLISKFVNTYGNIDVLINNAGNVFCHTPFKELDPDLWDATFNLNVKAPFYLSGSAFVHMQKQGGGRIINISSITVKYAGSETGMHYSAAKAALDNLTKGFAKVGAPHNILVNAIRCGVIDTPLRTKIKGYNEERFQKRIAMVPLGRPGQPIDIAHMALFLASENANFITGEIFDVAGGD
ncbi:SDR family oxidoreductase [Candidatus Woesearchaeota archaeon]|nr:SDR family oxidoreductase [Candidatus Woesearchaeota archaeon]